MVWHTCNPGNLGGRGRRSRVKVQGHQVLKYEVNSEKPEIHKTLPKKKKKKEKKEKEEREGGGKGG